MTDHRTDVGALLEEGGWTGYQKLLIAATALTIIFDGLDNQLLSAAIPAMMSEWMLPRSAFASVLAAALVGMAVGGFLGGYIGDRVGRRVALLASVISFGALTVVASFAADVGTLTTLRFFAGLGFGAAMPNAAALASEYVPLARRPFAVTVTIVCIPLGGTLAGVLGAFILPAFGWRTLFLVGGGLPLLVAMVLWTLLPESPRYLARQRVRWPELAAILRRLGHDVRPNAEFVDPHEHAVGRPSVGTLLAPPFRRDTLAIGAAFFFCLLSVYTAVTWVPSLLTGAGFDVAVANYGLTAFNLGGVVGALGGAMAFGRLGSRLTMLAMTAGGVAGCLLLAGTDIAGQSPAAVLAMLARRPDQRRADDDVRAGGALVSGRHPGDRRRHCRRGGAHGRRRRAVCGCLGARVGTIAHVRAHRSDAFGRLRRAGRSPQPHPPPRRSTLQSADQTGGSAMTPRIVLAASCSVLFGAVSLLAHHAASTAYDVDKKVTLRGTVTKVEWANPHVFFYLDVADTSGRVTNWAIESSTPNQLYRRGWRKNDLRIGEEVTLVDSSPARNGSPRAYGGTLTLANGRKVFSGSAATDQ